MSPHRHRPHRWHDLSPTARAVVTVVGAVDLVLRVVAVTDLVHRPADEVRGAKATWALALVGVNSLGLVPLLYLTRARRRQ